MSASDDGRRDAYARRAIPQVARLLSMQDRNPVSPTYGCFDRTYWLDRATDFPSAILQFGVQSLALVYKFPFVDNPYYGQAKVRDWCLAGMDYWVRIQHRDGSFDEFYPFERGWAGPTGFTLYAVLDAYALLKDEMPPELRRRVLDAAQRSARYIADGGQSGGVLANHHAMAMLAVWRAYQALGAPELRRGYERIWRRFLTHHTDEGWSLEYDGVDPGYLSATISFLGKIYKDNPADDMRRVLEQAIGFASHFVYPDGFYAGATGSRQTQHFYPHGFEALAGEIPLAAAMAERLLAGLDQGTLVPPEIMPDRYLCYRVPELLLAYLDYKPRPGVLPALPYERPPFKRYFSGAGVYVRKDADTYVVANLAKGGVVKAFSVAAKRLLYNDCGILGVMTGGQIVSSQWIDKTYRIAVADDELRVEGRLNRIPSDTFTVPRMVLFRLGLLALGWSTRFSQMIKGAIRRFMMLGAKPAPVRFQRIIRFAGDDVEVEDTIALEGGARLRALSLGDEFAVRYVPQSRYFQGNELNARGFTLDGALIEQLNRTRKLTVTRRLDARQGDAAVLVEGRAVGSLR